VANKAYCSTHYSRDHTITVQVMHMVALFRASAEESGLSIPKKRPAASSVENPFS